MIPVTRLIRRTLFSFVFFLTIWLGGLVWFMWQIPMHPSMIFPEADAIVVLTGGSGRLEHGLELLADKRGKVLFVSGVGKKATLADLMHYAQPRIRKNVENMPVILGHDAENTIGNAKETAAWLRKEGHKTIYLVTSNYHMPRSLVEMREVAPDMNFIPASVFPDDFTITGWWQDKSSRKLILLEYHKFLASKLRHWLVSHFRSTT